MIRVRPQTKGRFSHRALEMDLKEFAIGCGQLLESALKEEASLTARAAIKFSAPMTAKRTGRTKKGLFMAQAGSGGDGDEGKSQRWGEAATETAIRSVVKTVDESLLAATSDFSNLNDFIKWKMQNNDKPFNSLAISRIILSDADNLSQYNSLKAMLQNRASNLKPLDGDALKAWHHRVRRQFGYRKLASSKGRQGFQSQIENQRFATKETIDSYVLDAVQRVGYVKSGWVTCIRKIGPVKIVSSKYPMGREKVFGLSKLPKYITRHTGPASVTSNVPTAMSGGAKSNDYRIVIMNLEGNAGNMGRIAKVTENVLLSRTKARSLKVAKYSRLFNRAAAKFNAGT